MTVAQTPLAHARQTVQALLALTLAFLALVASQPAWADPPGRVGRIADTQGQVWLYDDEQGEWIEARRNRPVTAGDRVSAERGARAAIQIGSGTVRLDGDTEIEFVALDDQRVHMRLHGGSVALRLRSNDSAREFAVVTPEGRFEPTRAGRYRIDRNGNRNDGSFGAVIAGAMHFEAPDSALEIVAGQRAEFWSEGGRTHYAWANLSDDRFGEWVAREEREDDRYYERQSRDERRRYVSPEMTGAEDLDRDGDWDRHPDYGAIWYPRVVVAGWAPYRYGHWAHVRPWGWTWIDDAPWGFAPFHYGRWVWWGGRWGWCPGQYVARPVYAPALVAWIGGSQGSVGITIGGGPAVGWVPLSPREVYVPPYQVTNIYVRNVNVTHQPWHPPRPRDNTVRTGPIMYTNQGVPGGVTVVSSDVLKNRQPISSAVIKPVDPKTIANWQQQQQRQPTAAAPPPPAPAARVVPAPGGAVPAAPGAQRNTPWMPRAQERAAGGGNANDSGESHRARPQPPQAPAVQQVPVAPQQPRVERAEERRQDRQMRAVPPRPQPAAPRDIPPGQRERVQGADPRRIAPPVQAQPVPPTVPQVQPVMPQAQPRPGPAPVVVQPAPPEREGRGRDKAERDDNPAERRREQQNR
jgi:hypothetical protein